MERFLGSFDSGREDYGIIHVYYDADLQHFTLESIEQGRVLGLTDKEAVILFDQLDAIANYRNVIKP